MKITLKLEALVALLYLLHRNTNGLFTRQALWMVLNKLFELPRHIITKDINNIMLWVMLLRFYIMLEKLKTPTEKLYMLTP